MVCGTESYKHYNSPLERHNHFIKIKSKIEYCEQKKLTRCINVTCYKFKIYHDVAGFYSVCFIKKEAKHGFVQSVPISVTNINKHIARIELIVRHECNLIAISPFSKLSCILLLQISKSVSTHLR